MSLPDLAVAGIAWLEHGGASWLSLSYKMPQSFVGLQESSWFRASAFDLEHPRGLRPIWLGLCGSGFPSKKMSEEALKG